jgi:hypothetical protein
MGITKCYENKSIIYNSEAYFPTAAALSHKPCAMNAILGTEFNQSNLVWLMASYAWT